MSKAAIRSRIIKPLRGGQITIPFEFRRKLGIGEDTLLKVTMEDDELRVRKVDVIEAAQGSAWLEELYDLFAPVREDMARYGEGEIDSAIAAAVTGVRRKKRG